MSQFWFPCASLNHKHLWIDPRLIANFANKPLHLIFGCSCISSTNPSMSMLVGWWHLQILYLSLPCFYLICFWRSDEVYSVGCYKFWWAWLRALLWLLKLWHHNVGGGSFYTQNIEDESTMHRISGRTLTTFTAAPTNASVWRNLVRLWEVKNPL